MELTDSIRAVIRKSAKNTQYRPGYRPDLKVLQILDSSSSEEECIRRIKEEFPETFKDEDE